MMFEIFHKSSRKQAGFTLIEIMLVVLIIGAMLAVIVPRASRARTDAKYNSVRQMAAELGKWGMTWADRNLKIQAETDTAILNDYVASLVGFTGDTGTNWTGGTVAVNGRAGNPPNAVSGIMSTDQLPKNPFSGESYFNPGNDGTTPRTGQLNLATQTDSTGFDVYYLIFYGTETDGGGNLQWYAGQGPGSVDNLRNGVYVARLK